MAAVEALEAAPEGDEAVVGPEGIAILADGVFTSADCCSVRYLLCMCWAKGVIWTAKFMYKDVEVLELEVGTTENERVSAEDRRGKRGLRAANVNAIMTFRCCIT